jgi:hypothetical protein
MASRSKSRSKSRIRGGGDDSRRRSPRLSASKNMYKTPPPNNRRRLSSKRKRISSNGGVRDKYNNSNNARNHQNTSIKNKSPIDFILLVLKLIFGVIYDLLKYIYMFLYFIFVVIVGRERHDLSAVTNEYELLIRAIKELEFLLDTNVDHNDEEGNDDNDTINPEEQFVIPKGIYAKLHQFQMNGKKLPKKIIKKVLFINTLRNKLVHNYYTTSLEISEINVVKDVYAEVYKSLQGFIKKLEK